MVFETAKPHLETLAKAAKKLNKASDQYTAELMTIETEVNALNLGLNVTLRQPLKVSAAKEETDDAGLCVGCYRIAKYLGYKKHAKGWGFVVHKDKEWIDGNDDIKQWTRQSTKPLLECSREIRVASAEQILDLLNELENEAKRKITSMEEVMDARKS